MSLLENRLKMTEKLKEKIRNEGFEHIDDFIKANLHYLPKNKQKLFLLFHYMPNDKSYEQASYEKRVVYYGKG